MDIETIKKDLNKYYNTYRCFPKTAEISKLFNYSHSTLMKAFSDANINYQDYLASIDCFALNRPNIKYYDTYLEKLKNVIENNDENIGNNLYLFSKGNYCKKYKLPNIRWFIDNCPDKTVIDIFSFRKYINIKQHIMSKEECIEKILLLNKKLNRPLKYDDFRGYEYGQVSISEIKKYWGTLNKMKEALGLEIIQSKMTKTTQADIDFAIKVIQQYMQDNNREFITTNELNSIKGIVHTCALRNFIKENYNMSLKEYLEQFSIKVGNAGVGLKNIFADGEVTTSQYEYLFSNFLRNMGLRYNIDYFRNIKYSSFCDNYKGNMDCDYIINYNNKQIYVEIAGIIATYKLSYYNDKPIISSKSKERYRMKLKEKEKMLRSNNLIYFILFPCDLTDDNMEKIINTPDIKLREQI